MDLIYQKLRQQSNIKVEDLIVSYGKNSVLKDVSFTVNPGECLVLLGPSGSGKSTLLRAVAGLHDPDSGRIQINTETIFDDHISLSPQDRGVGMVFQDASLFPHLNVSENIMFGMHENNYSQVESLLDLVGLTGFGGRMPHSLSGGQSQRVALARALAAVPQVLLLDEPFSALDASLREQVRKDTRTLLRELKITSIFVTHDQDEAYLIGDRIAVLDEGILCQVGEPEHLYNYPVNPWVANFIGKANLVDGFIQPDGSVKTLIGVHQQRDSNFDPGTSVTAMYRPENLMVLEYDLENSEDNLVGVIKDILRYGHDIEYIICVDDLELTARVIGSQSSFSVNDKVMVSSSCDDVMVWPAAQ